MWNRNQTLRRCWLPVSSLRPISAARMLTTLLCLTALSGAAAIATPAAGQTELKSESAPTHSANPIPPKSSESGNEMAAGNPLWAISIEVLAATRDRPLFSPTRRPPAPPVFAVAAAVPARAQPPAEPERPPLLLIGTVAGEAKAIAVFLDQKTNRTVRLRGGQSQYGWVLGAVYRKEVVLHKDHAIFYLPLSAAAAAPAASPTQVAERLERRQR
jgi:general secretion pathway protein N